MAANVAVSVVVSGVIAITSIVSYFVFEEPLRWIQLLGTILVVCGFGHDCDRRTEPGMTF